MTYIAIRDNGETAETATLTEALQHIGQYAILTREDDAIVTEDFDFENDACCHLTVWGKVPEYNRDGFLRGWVTGWIWKTRILHWDGKSLR